MKKRYKILYISHSPYFNGAEICLLNLVKNINKDIFEPVIVFPNIGPLIDKIKALGIKTYISPIERWVRYRFEKPFADSDIKSRSLKIARIIDEESIDIVHSNSSVVLEGAIAAKLNNIPHIWHIHEYLRGHYELSACLSLPFIYEIISYLSQKIVCVSDFTKSQFEPIVDDSKLLTIYNGVEEDMNLKGDDFLRDFLNVKNNEIIAVTIGLLAEAKGYDNLLNAAAIVKEQGNNIKFIWVGGGSKKTIQNFNSKVKRLGLKNNVFYLGFREDIRSILKSSNLLILPSLMETLSLAILEAMASGLPVITTDCGGPSECVKDGETGFIVPINDPVKLSEKIIELCEDSLKRKMFGENGHKYFTENFRASVYAEKFEKLYMQIINKDSVPTSIKDKMLIDSFLQVYKVISDNHWKLLKKGKII